MATMKDWAEEAAKEICEIFNLTDYDSIAVIIDRHCPFKRDTLYEEVGETSRKLDQILEMVKYLRSR